MRILCDPDFEITGAEVAETAHITQHTVHEFEESPTLPPFFGGLSDVSGKLTAWSGRGARSGGHAGNVIYRPYDESAKHRYCINGHPLITD